MPAGAKKLFRAALGCFIQVPLLSALACGSQGASLLPEGRPDDIGYVGGGGFGGGRRDAGGTDDGGGATMEADASHPSGDEDAGVSSGRNSDAAVDDASAMSDGGSSVGVTFNEPPGFFSTLHWSISGPSGSYSGTVDFGPASSVEFVVGGIQSGDGYTIVLSGTDRDGDLCSGTSAPFDVVPGKVATPGLTLNCQRLGDAANSADVTTGSVAVDAGVVLSGP